jgi:outer membrane lipoprotein carrier protein
MHRWVFLLAFALASPLGAAQSAPPAPSPPSSTAPPQTAASLAKALQGRYQGIQDFSADFVQTYRGGVLKTQTQERGTVAVKKPGRMRWVYTTPEHKELISDGRKIYWYVAEDKQVVVNDMPADDQAATPALFLSGKGDIARDFTATTVASPTPGTVALKLVPRRPEPEYEYLTVALDPATLQIRSLTTRDRQGGESTLTLMNMKENRRLSDKDFVFRLPRGVKVVTDGTR